jgi:membrane-bound lytic murein transglycosylase D
MKHILNRNFLFLFIFTSITNLTIASPLQMLNDTTVLAANAKNNNMLIAEANVTYPATLASEKEASVKFVEQYSQKERGFLMEMFKKGQSYFPHITSVLQQYSLPEELKVLVAIESEFNANARSRAGAVGYWQMMDALAVDMGLNISRGKKKKGNDDRKNFFKSTVAAIKYLKDQYSQFNSDLLLTVAAYNCGAGNVMKAIRKSGVADATFWDIKKYLPAETRSYVMKFISFNVIFENFDKFANNQLLFTDKMLQAPTQAIAEPMVN